MIRQTKQHGTLSKAVEVKVFLPEIPIVGMGKFKAKMLHKRFRPPNGRWFTAASVDDILERVNEDLEANYGMCKFRLVELGFGRFNLIGSLKCSDASQSTQTQAVGTGQAQD